MQRLVTSKMHPWNKLALFQLPSGFTSGLNYPRPNQRSWWVPSGSAFPSLRQDSSLECNALVDPPFSLVLTTIDIKEISLCFWHMHGTILTYQELYSCISLLFSWRTGGILGIMYWEFFWSALWNPASTAEETSAFYQGALVVVWCFEFLKIVWLPLFESFTISRTLDNSDDLILRKPLCEGAAPVREKQI